MRKLALNDEILLNDYCNKNFKKNEENQEI